MMYEFNVQLVGKEGKHYHSLLFIIGCVDGTPLTNVVSQLNRIEELIVDGFRIIDISIGTPGSEMNIVRGEHDNVNGTETAL